MPADTDRDIQHFVREQFPALNSDWVFMDNAGGSLPLARVIARAADYLSECPVQLGASYAVSELAQARLDEATAAIARFTNARHPSEVIIGPSTSVLISRLSRALRPRLSPGDEIVVTNVDHEANISPWRRLERDGLVLRTWELNRDTLRLELDDLAPLMNERTRMVCFTHTSNILGSIEPIREITDFVHAHGAQACVDGVAYAPHHSIDVQAWNVDYYTFSLYKVYGPHQAVMIGKRDQLEALDNINHYFFAPEDIPYKFQPGGMNYELAYASGGIPDYYLDLGMRAGASTDASDRDKFLQATRWMSQHEETLARPLLEYLDQRPDTRIIGAASPSAAVRTPTISFVVDGRNSASIPTLTDRHGIAIRWGHFYAPRLIEYLGLAPQSGVVRASLVHYNQASEVQRLIEVLDAEL